MATITKMNLSYSNMGNGISITATQGATYNKIHDTTSGTAVIDELYVYAQNNYSQVANVVIEWGTSQSGQQLICPVNPQDGPQLLIPGFLLFGSAGCQTISCFVNGLAGSASPAISGSSLMTVFGYVHRISGP